MKMMKTLCLILISTIAGSCLASEIELRAVHHFRGKQLVEANKAEDASGKIPPRAEAPPNLVVWIFLTSHGNREIKIPTENLANTGIENRDGRFQVELFANWGSNPMDIKAIVPETAWGIATLRPGETVVIRKEYLIFREEKFTGVDVTYEVPEDLAKRYGFWSGNLKAESIDRMAVTDALNAQFRKEHEHSREPKKQP